MQDALLASAERLPDKPALVVAGEPRTFGELCDASLRLAAALQRRGLRRGDRVAIFMDNSWPCAVAIHGVLLAGGVFLVVNAQTKSDKLAYILDDSDARFLLTSAHLARTFQPAVAAARTVAGVIVSGGAPRAAGGAAGEDFDAVLAASEPSISPPGTIPLDLAALIYTSGSTGQPKGVMMTHQSMVFTNGSLIEYLRLSEDDRILDVLPLAFDYGLYQLLMAVQLGATLVLERSFVYPAEVLQRMAEQRVSVFPGVPTIFATLLSMHKRQTLCFPDVTRVTNTAAALPPDFVRGLRAIFPNALVYRMYGLTECKRALYLEPELLDAKPTSVGKAIPGTEAFVLSEDGRPVLPGEVGVLHVRGPHVMLGYWKQPELSREMLRDGPLPGERILCTHDRFRTDEDGFLYFVGRSDDIIKTRGEKVSPIEVENVLHGIPGIREAAVLGVPDEVLGQAVRAYVALDEGAALSEKEIQRICLARLENFMVPREVVFLRELPKTPTGKIRKQSLLEP